MGETQVSEGETRGGKLGIDSSLFLLSFPKMLRYQLCGFWGVCRLLVLSHQLYLMVSLVNPLSWGVGIFFYPLKFFLLV